MSYLERIIVQRLISDLLDRGYSLGVNDGEETTLTHSSDMLEITSAMYSTDEDFLLVYRENANHPFGWVRLIHGNGRDIISDYTTNLEDDLQGVNAYCDLLEAA